MSLTPTPDERTEQLRLEIGGVADRLRRMAADLESRVEVRTDIRTQRLDHTKAASEVVHVVAWGFANLHLDDVVNAAAAADAAHRDAE